MAAGAKALDRADPGTTKLTPGGKSGGGELELTGDDLAEIDRAAAEIPVEGERYPASLMAFTGR